ncbi:peptidoglycan-binding domain-containing protein [Promicromonospora sp. NPDC060271]|uniref:peptidoglycan-binding domain-containing protein n=1 Tax=Promicromonospora sp. NPDC060271 TaxID=3347089 RepID=UPI00365947DD
METTRNSRNNFQPFTQTLPFAEQEMPIMQRFAQSGTYFESTNWLQRISMLTALAILFSGFQVMQVVSAPSASAVSICSTVEAITTPSRNGGSVWAPVTDSISGSLNCAMWNGHTGSSYSLSAEHLQKSLNRCYGENLTTDGKFGWRTEDALWRAQGDEGIKQDGIYGIESARNILHHRYGGGCGRVR